jgi:hypothetical protein
MDEEQREWQKQLAKNFGLREYIRFMAAFIVWIFLGVALCIILGSIVPFIVFLLAPFAFAGPRWKPAYSLLRLILGNKNLPIDPMPRAHKVADIKASMVWLFAGDLVPSFGLDIAVHCHQVCFKMNSFNPGGSIFVCLAI